jgi:Ni,Fe-hydrogenase I large subunit
LSKVTEFIESIYIPDLFEVAAEFSHYLDVGRGHGNFLCYGGFDACDGSRFIPPGVVIDGKWEALDPSAITEDVSHSRYALGAPQHPSKGDAEPAPGRSGAYTWVKAPRYRGLPMEVGPLARVMTQYMQPGGSAVKTAVDELLGQLKLGPEKLHSVLGRHVARGLEARWIARQAARWLDEIEIDAPTNVPFDIPQEANGYGLVEAPRGALGHWLTVKDHRIANYQCIVPTTWNCSPRDGQGLPGPVEKALEGTFIKNSAQPIEVGRVVRSFDPCLACAIH